MSGKALLTSSLTFKKQTEHSPSFGNLVQMLKCKIKQLQTFLQIKNETKATNVMGEQNKSKLKFQQLRLFKPAKPPTRALW